jgi:hypothetical protein
VPWINIHLVPKFLALREKHPGEVSVQTTGFFGGRPALAWTPLELTASLEIPFDVAESGRYAVRLIALADSSGGSFELQIDGQVAGETIDLRSSEEQERDLLLGTHELATGNHTLSVRSVGAGVLSVEMLRLLRLPPEANRFPKNENEAHFIRLGIGRATYAFRLAYGRLPESLQELVDTGIMEDRYLKDENGYALVCRREGDFLLVDSTAADGWSHRWQGLDARR